MDINILDYLNEEEIKDICKDEIRSHVRETFKEKDLQRIISNSAYYKAFGIVDDSLPDGYEKTVVENVEKILKESTGFCLFRKADRFNEASPAQKIVDNAVQKNKEIIESNVTKTITTYFTEDNQEQFNGKIMEKIIDKIWDTDKIQFSFEKTK